MAAEDKKISQLTSETVNIDSMPNDMYVPIVCQGITKKINLKLVINSILSKIAAVTPYESGQGGVEQADLTTILNNYQNLANRVTLLESEGPWPEFTLTLTDGVNPPVPYKLKTCPNGGNASILIKTSEVTYPDLYAVLSISGDPTVSGRNITVTVQFNISNNYSNLNLDGATLDTLAASGSITYSMVNGGTGTISLTGSPIDLTNAPDRTLPPGSTAHVTKLASMTLTGELPQGVSASQLQQVTVSGTVNGNAIYGEASYSIPSHGGWSAAGYITL